MFPTNIFYLTLSFCDKAEAVIANQAVKIRIFQRTYAMVLLFCHQKLNLFPSSVFQKAVISLALVLPYFNLRR